MKQNKVFTILWMVVLLSICLSQYSFAKKLKPEPPIAINGVLDLRSANFSAQDYTLGGYWRLYWNQMRTPDDSAGIFEYVKFPELWNNTVWKGLPLPSSGFGTYEATVLLPPKSKSLGLRLPDFYTSYRLFVNGEEFSRNGVTGTDQLVAKPAWFPVIKPLPAGSDTLHLVLQVSNFDHQKGGPYKQIFIGDLTRLEAENQFNDALDFLLAGCILMGGLFFLGLYLFGSRDRYILFFSLFCLLYNYRILGTKNYALHVIFPNLPWSLAVHLEYLSLFLSVFMFVIYTGALYPEDTNKKIINTLAIICLAFSLVTLVTPPIIFSHLISTFLGLMVIYLGYAFYVYFVAVRKQRVGSIYALMSTGSLLIIFITILLEYFGIMMPEKILITGGYLSFLVLQSLILSYKFAFTLNKAKEDAIKGLKAKNEFLSTISHEIKTPLNSVIGIAHLMLRSEPRADQKTNLETLLVSGNNLLNIVNDIFDFNKIESGVLKFSNERFNISALAQGIMASLSTTAQETGLKLVLELDPTIPEDITGDADRTQQVIVNLLGNAIKFTKSGWVKLTVAVENLTAADVTLKIAVQDTGVGIPAEMQNVIFHHFTQADSSTSRNFSGTGLGLAITQRLLELQKVQLHLDSTIGVGSTFSFVQTFPLFFNPETEGKPQKKANKGEDSPLLGVSILIVEDNPMNVFVVQSFLKRWGANSEVATNGIEALEKLEKSEHHLILMDLHMPVLDGYEATRQLRKRGETRPIIALTASLSIGQNQDISALGFDDIVIKPFNPDQLLLTIKRFTEK